MSHLPSLSAVRLPDHDDRFPALYTMNISPWQIVNQAIVSPAVEPCVRHGSSISQSGPRAGFAGGNAVEGRASGSSFSCSTRKAVSLMTSCTEARVHLEQYGNSRLDGNGDGGAVRKLVSVMKSAGGQPRSRLPTARVSKQDQPVSTLHAS